MGQCVAKPAAADDVVAADDAAQGAAASRGAGVLHAAASASRARAAGAGGAKTRLARRGSGSAPVSAVAPPGGDPVAAAASRRVAAVTRDAQALADRVTTLRTVDALLPRRDSGGANTALARRKSVPVAPGVIFAALEAAIRNSNTQWATSNADVAALLADDVEYIDLRGEVSQGRAAALASMDAGMDRLLRRISRSTRSGANDHIKLKADGPTPAGKGVWVTVFTFKLYLMAVRIQEEYTFDGDGRIVRLERSMANAAQAKLVARA